MTFISWVSIDWCCTGDKPLSKSMIIISSGLNVLRKSRNDISLNGCSFCAIFDNICFVCFKSYTTIMAIVINIPESDNRTVGYTISATLGLRLVFNVWIV